MTPFGKILGDVLRDLDVVGLQMNNEVIIGFNYMYEHPKKIVSRLNAMANDPQRKGVRFPLIAALLDVEEEVGVITHIDRFTMIIAAPTSLDFNAEQRDDNLFIPLLIPIYERMMKVFKDSTDLVFPDTHKRYLRYLWGSENFSDGENVLDIPVDAIELSFRDVRVTKKC